MPFLLCSITDVKRTFDDLVAGEPTGGIAVPVGLPEIIVIFFPILFCIKWDIHFFFFFLHQTVQLGSCEVLVDIGDQPNRCREMAFIHIDRRMYDGICDLLLISVFHEWTSVLNSLRNNVLYDLFFDKLAGAVDLLTERLQTEIGDSFFCIQQNTGDFEFAVDLLLMQHIQVFF